MFAAAYIITRITSAAKFSDVRENPVSDSTGKTTMSYKDKGKKDKNDKKDKGDKKDKKEKKGKKQGKVWGVTQVWFRRY
jgi:chromatin remodeling complex protein RSC6